MKRYIPRSLAAILALALLFLVLTHRAEAAAVTLTGAKTVTVGDTVTLTFSVGGTNIYGLQAHLDYDSDQLELLDITSCLNSAWILDQNDDAVMIYDEQLSTPINTAADVFSVSFRVKDAVFPDGTVSASITDICATDGDSDTALGSAVWRASVKPNCDLNGDGVTDTTDQTLLVRHVAGIEALPDSSKADINGDGIVSAADLTALTGALANTAK